MPKVRACRACGLSCACASVPGWISLILELDQPLAGVIQTSSAPMRDAFVHLGG